MQAISIVKQIAASLLWSVRVLSSGLLWVIGASPASVGVVLFVALIRFERFLTVLCTSGLVCTVPVISALGTDCCGENGGELTHQ